MTKIKDLVSVVLDNVFVMFPIDSERYELTSAAFTYWQNRLISETASCAAVSSDSRICDMLEAIDQTFLRCVQAYLRSSSIRADEPTALDIDRSNRVKAAFHDVHLPLSVYGSTPRLGRAICTFLWSSLVDQLLHDKALQSTVPTDRRLST